MKTLKNTTIIFETREQFLEFWDNYIATMENGEVVNNTFIVTKNRWLLRLVTWFLS